ncbi:MAG TPA: nucleotidyltransferase domain-containing protein [Thermoanaerobaculia bacterium]|nr:nucleotidyltransferase domain-containing protein [Thermoanaerobaculia bacterium]
MHPMIANRKIELEALCERFGVRRLEVFGSAAGERFNDSRSDLDFLVDFAAASPAELADRYFGLLEELEGLFGRPIDLVMTAAIKNPYFLQGIQPSRRLLYAA